MLDLPATDGPLSTITCPLAGIAFDPLVASFMVGSAHEVGPHRGLAEGEAARPAAALSLRICRISRLRAGALLVLRTADRSPGARWPAAAAGAPAPSRHRRGPAALVQPH